MDIYIVDPHAYPFVRAPALLFSIVRVTIQPDLRAADKDFGVAEQALPV
jgi:hypothetical protein